MMAQRWHSSRWTVLRSSSRWILCLRCSTSSWQRSLRLPLGEDKTDNTATGTTVAKSNAAGGASAQPTTPGQSTDTGAPGSQPPAANAAAGSLAFRVNVVDPTIILLAAPERHDMRRSCSPSNRCSCRNKAFLPSRSTSSACSCAACIVQGHAASAR